MRTGSRRHRISTVFQIPGRRADSLRIGRYTNFLDITCESYQRIYSKLLDAAGIANGRITGNGHTWNAVKIDSKWCQMDPTWDDTSDNWYGDLDQRHLYFGLADELMAIAHSDHMANYQKDGYAHHSTDLSNNYFVRTGKADEWAEKYADRIQQHLDAFQSR